MSQASSTRASSSAATSSTSEFDIEHSFHNLGPFVIRPGYGKDIDPTLVIPSITRPVWEPPALEVLDIFETKFWERMEEEILAKAMPNITIRTEALDHHRLLLVISRYAIWARHTGKNAIEIVDEEKEVFYEGLLHELLREYAEETWGYFTLMRQHAPDLYNTILLAPPNGPEDEKEGIESYRITDVEKGYRHMFTLRPADDSSVASFATAATSCDSETSSNISDWIDTLSGLRELFTDWIDNVFDLDILFGEAEVAPAAAHESPHPSPDNSVVQVSGRVLMHMKPGVLGARASISFPPFSLREFAGATSNARPCARPAPFDCQRTPQESQDLMDPEPPSAMPSATTSPISFSDNLIDLDTSVTSYRSSSTDLDIILQSTGLNEMSEIDRLLS